MYQNSENISHKSENFWPKLSFLEFPVTTVGRKMVKKPGIEGVRSSILAPSVRACVKAITALLRLIIVLESATFCFRVVFSQHTIILASDSSVIC